MKSVSKTPIILGGVGLAGAIVYGIAHKKSIKMHHAVIIALVATAVGAGAGWAYDTYIKKA